VGIEPALLIYNSPHKFIVLSKSFSDQKPALLLSPKIFLEFPGHRLYRKGRDL